MFSLCLTPLNRMAASAKIYLGERSRAFMALLFKRVENVAIKVRLYRLKHYGNSP